MPDWRTLGEQIAAANGTPFAVERHTAKGGGCINAAHVVEGNGQRYFVKTNDVRLLDMFEAEAAGLREILASGAIRAPAPICWGIAGNQAFLALEYVEMAGGSTASAVSLGRQLAQMHRAVQSRFGWYRDNTIGATPQINTPEKNWLVFWRKHRLGFQLDLAKQNGACSSLLSKGEKLMSRCDVLFGDYAPQPSLLHGDLWGGNYSAARDGSPVIFDPAVYHGDREADIAMTELFGGFPACFYDAYQEAWPLDPGYRTRKTFYNLYHILNHFNLFGGGYAGQAEGMIERLLAETC